MSSNKVKPGPKKSPKVARLEGRIRNLEKKLEEALEGQSKEKTKVSGDLPSFAMGLNYFPEKRLYKLVELKYNLETGEAAIINTKYAGDSIQRAMFEAKKFLAHKIDSNLKTK